MHKRWRQRRAIALSRRHVKSGNDTVDALRSIDSLVKAIPDQMVDVAGFNRFDLILPSRPRRLPVSLPNNCPFRPIGS